MLSSAASASCCWSLSPISNVVRDSTRSSSVAVFSHNTYFTTLIRTSGIFADVFVPINPGNAGLAVGGPLLVASRDGNSTVSRDASPFLGPEYDSNEIKAELHGCKLSYEFLSGLKPSTSRSTHSLAVSSWGGFRDAWNGVTVRSAIEAFWRINAPYVLDNLNSFLRKRERWRSFGVSICGDDLDDYCGPPHRRGCITRCTPTETLRRFAM